MGKKNVSEQTDDEWLRKMEETSEINKARHVRLKEKAQEDKESADARKETDKIQEDVGERVAKETKERGHQRFREAAGAARAQTALEPGGGFLARQRKRMAAATPEAQSRQLDKQAAEQERLADVAERMAEMGIANTMARKPYSLMP